MGMFDNIFFSCPKCDGEMYTQSKEGNCCLNTYHGIEGVPPSIAYDINGDEVWCESCGQAYKVIADPIPPPVLVKCHVVINEA
jgi:uncharacterized protein YbaR (Trm112 family)